jgi:hypothetical protein
MRDQLPKLLAATCRERRSSLRDDIRCIDVERRPPRSPFQLVDWLWQRHRQRLQHGPRLSERRQIRAGNIGGA